LDVGGICLKVCVERESGKTNGQRGTHLTVFSVGETVWLCCRYTTLRYPQKFIGGSDEDPFECHVQYVDKGFGYDFEGSIDNNMCYSKGFCMSN